MKQPENISISEQSFSAEHLIIQITAAPLLMLICDSVPVACPEAKALKGAGCGVITRLL